MTAPDAPGLFDAGAPTHRLGALREAVEDTITALQAEGQLSTRHRGLIQLARTLADATEAGAHGRRASAAAMAARELRETLALLMPDDEQTGDGWDAWLAAIRDGADPRAAEVRDPSES